MDDALFDQIALTTGLSPSVCRELFDRGWAFVTEKEGPSVWISPTACLPAYIPHDEPECNNKCGNLAPHKHGFPCNIACESCNALCHPKCPAYRIGM